MHFSVRFFVRFFLFVVASFGCISCVFNFHLFNGHSNGSARVDLLHLMNWMSVRLFLFLHINYVGWWMKPNEIECKSKTKLDVINWMPVLITFNLIFSFSLHASPFLLFTILIAPKAVLFRFVFLVVIRQ